ncbi:hypothetical protein JCM19233_7317 [Vibrio astriarenae]|nr:hypothetical protein JCM19233_7317 [Vibrio sp. C7]
MKKKTITMTTLSIEANLNPLTHQQGLKMDSDKFSQLISHIKTP